MDQPVHADNHSAADAAWRIRRRQRRHFHNNDTVLSVLGRHCDHLAASSHNPPSISGLRCMSASISGFRCPRTDYKSTKHIDNA